MEDLAVIKAPQIIQFILGRILLSLREKNKNVIHHPRSVCIGKNCGRGLESNADFQAHE